MYHNYFLSPWQNNTKAKCLGRIKLSGGGAGILQVATYILKQNSIL
jgi:Tfp pilus assembly PilM family ATPase